MEEMLLVRPSAEYLPEVASYRQDFLDCESAMDGTGSLRRCEDPADWLEAVERNTRPETTPTGLVPATQFLYVRASDRAVVGMIQVRHCFNDYLREFAGHIGYSIRPSERRKGYATQMLHDCLPYCKELGLDRVLVCCLEHNEGSRRTILANGGVFDRDTYEPNEGETIKRYWITL